MAAKTADSIRLLGTIGEWYVHVASFQTANLDDNDTWDTGLDSLSFWFSEQTSEGANDLVFDAKSGSTLTFGGGSNIEGYVYLISKGY